MQRRDFLALFGAVVVVGVPTEGGVPSVAEAALEDYIGQDLWLTTFDISGVEKFTVLIHNHPRKGIDNYVTLIHAGAEHIVDMKTNTAVFTGGTEMPTLSDEEIEKRRDTFGYIDGVSEQTRSWEKYGFS